MPVLNTQSLYTSFVRKFSIGQNRQATFKESFLSAFNEVLYDLYNEGRLSTEPNLLKYTEAPTPDNSGTATEFAPTTGEIYHQTDDDVYYLAVATDGSAQEFTNADYWEQVYFTSDVEQRYLPQINVGMRFFLQTQGEWVKGDDIDRYAGLSWERAKGVIENAQVLDQQEAGTYYGPFGAE